MPLTSLPPEIHIEILTYITDEILDQIAASAAYPLWSELLTTSRTFLKSRYFFSKASPSVGIHKLLFHPDDGYTQWYGPSLRLETVYNSERSTMEEFAYGNTNCHSCRACGCFSRRQEVLGFGHRFLDERVVWIERLPVAAVAAGSTGVLRITEPAASQSDAADFTDTSTTATSTATATTTVDGDDNDNDDDEDTHSSSPEPDPDPDLIKFIVTVRDCRLSCDMDVEEKHYFRNHQVLLPYLGPSAWDLTVQQLLHKAAEMETPRVLTNALNGRPGPWGGIRMFEVRYSGGVRVMMLVDTVFYMRNNPPPSIEREEEIVAGVLALFDDADKARI
ncbi:hypothetical protein TWF730_006288 [Orbilia blumenaviensis]|uniref:F-box domain-containing protein n=1 Tax=Orbilia blumenaviensis TaxID=1796055 RepID=A0AAV9VDT5_9PEZI